MNGHLLGDFAEKFICSYKQMLKEMLSSSSGCWHIWIQYLEIKQTSCKLARERELRMNPINQAWHGRSTWRNTAPWCYTWTAKVILEVSHLRIPCFRRLLLKQFDPRASDTFNQVIVTSIGEFICLYIISETVISVLSFLWPREVFRQKVLNF